MWLEAHRALGVAHFLLAPDAPDAPDWRAPLQPYLRSGVVHLLNRAARLRYGTLQSDTGRALLRQHGHPSDYMSSAVLIEYGEPGARAGAAPGSGRAKAGRCTTHSTISSARLTSKQKSSTSIA